MEHPALYKGREAVVLGLARSGQAVAKLLNKYGVRVTINDRKAKEDCPEADELEKEGIRVICGGHPDFLIHPNLAFVVKNPGIPYHIPPLQKAEQLGIEVITEVEIAYYLLRTAMIGITGSNGKTTTTTWVGHMLAEAGIKYAVAGNIGIPLCEAVEENTDSEWIVSELSSFQLKGTRAFRPDIACVLNISETHLDYHGTMEDYIASKTKLVKRQLPEDTAVLNWDDPVCRKMAEHTAARRMPFSLKGPLDYGVYLDEGMIVYRAPSGLPEVVLPADRLGIPGKHNIQNALAATAIAVSAGVPIAVISHTLERFAGVEHRLERVRDWQGILFYNNSKATNITSTVTAIDSFDSPIVLIAGGLDRGADFSEMIPCLKERIKAVISLGETAGAIHAAAQAANVDALEMIEAKDPQTAIETAVQAAARLAEPGDIVLLSPSCASWDMFRNFEERGNMFKQAVHNL